MARHEMALCTPETAQLYWRRLGRRPVTEMPLGKPIEYGSAQLTALPAGHCLGSAMLFAETDGDSFLYTGDFKLGASLTSVEAEPRHAKTLIMESTFGRPDYRLPPREQVIEELVGLVRSALDEGKTPVVHGYALGKSQEATKILTTHGIPVQQHREVWRISKTYEKCGMKLSTGDASVSLYEEKPKPGHAVVTIPKTMKSYRLGGLGETVSIAITGWAKNPSTKYRLQVDHALPLSDHADFDELIEFARLVNPERVLCTHGPREFVDHLLDEGFNAEPLVPDKQKRLF